MMDKIEDLFSLIQRHDTFLLVTHINPDGDALGSVLGLGLAILSLGKKVVMFIPQPIPVAYRFLPGSELLQSTVEPLEKYEIGIVLDCADIARTGEKAQKVLERAEKLINIDHHISNRSFADLNILDPQAAATGEIICDLLLQAKISVTPQIATNLYTTIITDTGSFQHQNTTAKSLRVAAFLMDCGADGRNIQQHLYQSRSLESLRLLSKGLESLALNRDGTVAWISLSKELLSSIGVTADDSEGMIDYVKSLRDVEVGIMFKEINPCEIKVSFRSKSFLNVDQLAGYFGGGGHKRAAGCTINGEINDVEQLVLRKTEELLLEMKRVMEDSERFN